eukprot:CAMPEP_0178404472 /NCGR_PEP_ID=MMETSP0689_2-20121128/17903_1 /TAXON_ID=160604 /ORGANISM="Amphidinium massartii, Strain CS-259" /LENGTH=458 /DNA_ID=CAMNT_0020025461 /DNA_START=18 /DNA_END=1394 /DNA_ORIENTATION=+
MAGATTEEEEQDGPEVSPIFPVDDKETKDSESKITTAGDDAPAPEADAQQAAVDEKEASSEGVAAATGKETALNEAAPESAEAESDSKAAEAKDASASAAAAQEQPAQPTSISLTRPPPELPPDLSRDFEVEHTLGEGAYACVLQARQKQTGAVVALKIVEKQPLAIRNMLPQLQREVRIQGHLQHPNILKLISCMEDTTHVYMLLEFCPGGSLRGVAARLPLHRFPEPMAARYMAMILQGVDFMHRCSCVHRDLKPDNVLLTVNDEVRICDFGWSAEVTAERLLLTTCGTPDYWPPEIFEGHPQSAGVDLWALGCLVYELLIGHPPFWGTMEEIKMRVLAVDVRYPQGILTNEAINLFFCLLQRDQRTRVPARHLLEQHPWIWQVFGGPPAARGGMPAPGYAPAPAFAPGTGYAACHGQHPAMAAQAPAKEPVQTTARPVSWDEIPVAVMINGVING